MRQNVKGVVTEEKELVTKTESMSLNVIEKMKSLN
jgi:hypothetical protein